jgi:hypothetical protein
MIAVALAVAFCKDTKRRCLLSSAALDWVRGKQIRNGEKMSFLLPSLSLRWQSMTSFLQHRSIRHLLLIVGIGLSLPMAPGAHAVVDNDHGWTAPSSASPMSSRSIGDYRRNLKAFMKLSKDVDHPAIQRAAIFNLCQLHHQMVRDPRFNSSQTLQGMRVVASNRLEKFAKEFRKRAMREQRLKSPAAKETDSESLSNHAGSHTKPSEIAVVEAELAVGKSFRTMSRISGGPTCLLNYRGQFAPPWDHGWQLVELIENTIHPESWRNNGGTGAIHYYQPLRVLVIGASSQVHQDTLELLGRIRANQ